MLEQSIIHKEYIFWLKDQINDWIFDQNKPIKQNRKNKSNKVYHSYSFQTVCHPVFIEFHNAFYSNNKKIIDIEFIKKYFSLYSLAIWLMDDGTISKNRNIVICSHSFSKEENEILQGFIFEKFNLKTNIWINDNNNNPLYYLAFPKEDSIKLTNLVKEYFIPSFTYKLISPETTKETY
jgi:hypothetical protein